MFSGDKMESLQRQYHIVAGPWGLSENSPGRERRGEQREESEQRQGGREGYRRVRVPWGRIGGGGKGLGAVGVSVYFVHQE